MKTIALLARLALAAVVPALVLSAGGCASIPADAPTDTPSVPRLPPSADVRALMGQVAVVLRSADHGPVDLYRPVGRASNFSAVDRGFSEAKKDFRSPGYADQAGAFILLPLWVADGLAHTAAAVRLGDTETEMQQAAAELSPALAEVKFSKPLRDRVVALAHGQASDGIAVSVTDPGCTYAALADAGSGTVLEITVGHPSLDGGTTPWLALGVTVQVRLVDARTGRELYCDHLGYRGSARRLAAWATNHGQPLRDEADQCVRALAGEIVAQLFTRPADTAPDARALAALGLSHRAPPQVASR
jgi:hypothetical protein